jgi:hypothetical protein
VGDPPNTLGHPEGRADRSVASSIRSPKLIELRSNSAIQAVDRGCMNSRSIVKTRAGEHDFAQDFQVTHACNLVLQSAKRVAME